MNGEQRKEALRRVAVGELAPDSDEIRALSANDPSFAFELGELTQLQGTLDDLETERRAAEQAGAQLEHVPGRWGPPVSSPVRRGVDRPCLSSA